MASFTDGGFLSGFGDKLTNALMGFSAGVSGNGMQYLQQMRQNQLGGQYAQGDIDQTEYLRKLTQFNPELAGKLALNNAHTSVYNALANNGGRAQTAAQANSNDILAALQSGDLTRAKTLAANAKIDTTGIIPNSPPVQTGIGNKSPGIPPEKMDAEFNASASANSETPPTSNVLSGEDYLKTLPKTSQEQVKALAEGRMQFPSGFALKSPYWQQMISAVSQYDPAFDTLNYNSRSGTRKNFTSGKAAQNITALNTAMGHLGSLSEHFDTLNNSDYPSWNAVANAIGVEAGNKKIQEATSKVDTDKSAVANELAKVFRSTGMSQGEIRDWENKINSSKGPTQMKATIGTALDLMDSRLDALGQEYNRGMGTSQEPLQLLSPKAQETYNKLKLNAKPQTKGGVSEGSIAVNSKTDQKIIRKGGKWLPM